MPRHKLDFDLPEADFLLFGICSQTNDYRLVWSLNKNLRLSFSRENDIMVGETAYSLFSCTDEENGIKYYLSQNKNKGNVFFKELKQMDYLLIVDGNRSGVNADSLLTQVKQAESVLAVYQLDSFKISSKQHLIIG